MIDVRLQYKPWPFLPAKEKRFKLPENWGEMDERQFLAVHRFGSGTDPDIDMLAQMLGCGKGLIRKLDLLQRMVLIKTFAFIKEAKPVDRFIIERIGKLWAPPPKLKYVTFAQFIFADTYYQDYLNGHKTALNKFIAALYLRPGKKFNEAAISADAEIVDTLPILRRRAISTNYKLIREWLALSYPYVFKKADKLKKKKKAADAGWLGVLNSIVGDDIIKRDEYSALQATYVLWYLNDKIKNYRRNGGKV